jgi:SAM-dependent methyltransferase
MTPDERWLAALWPSVRAPLPAPPARVLEIGCGPLGGFVPMLRADGYEATGIDPEAPEEGTGFRRIGFEDYQPARPADAIIACTSLHHVADLRRVVDLAAAALIPDGDLVVVEWARERFNEATAQWCFARLPSGGDRGWLNDRYEQWQASGQSWDAYLRSWANGEGLHSGEDILRALRARFKTREFGHGAYFFADLSEVSEADELAAIGTGQIRANRIQYHGTRRPARR